MNFQEMERGLDGVLNSGLSDSGIRSALGVRTYPTDTEVAQKVSVLAEADETLSRANAIAMGLMGLADRLCGPIPTSGEKSGAGEGPGALNTFRAHMRDTRQALIYADEALNRIERELVG